MNETVKDANGLVPCRGCGKRIIFAKTDDGKTVPLDPSPPVYFVERMSDGTNRATRTASPKGDSRVGHAVSHFATCPAAAQFSGKGKKT